MSLRHLKQGTARVSKIKNSTNYNLDLERKSPSCGSQLIYDGQFSGIKKAGVGVATAYFIQQGMTVYSEETWQLADISFLKGKNLVKKIDYSL